MIFKDQYGVGDSATSAKPGHRRGGRAAGHPGPRRQGTVWYVRNGEIIRVDDQSQNWARTVLDIPVALNQDLQARAGGAP